MSIAIDQLPTIEQLNEKLREAREKIAALTVQQSYTIEDYPIGGSNRGKCKLWTEFKKGNGYRMCRSTTNKFGRWCNPKKSTYHESVIVVVTGGCVEREAAWLQVGKTGFFLVSASWSTTTVLVESPVRSSPNREPSPYTINGEPRELPADPPEVCDLWDVWKPAMIEVLESMHAKWKEFGPL